MLVSQPSARRRIAPAPRRRQEPRSSLAGAVVPFDYGALFNITGRPGNVAQDVITISPDAVFVAVAIGYGFEQARMRPLQIRPFQQNPQARRPDTQIQLSDFSLLALVEGFRVNPDFSTVIFQSPGGAVPAGAGDFVQQPVSQDLLDRCFQRVRPPTDISFLFSMVDSSSGRELMDEPVHNLAGLGKSNGERPFRLLAHPLTFLPRSTVRVQIIERTPDITGTLFIVLYGYKILSGSACPEPSAQWLSDTATRGRLLNQEGERAIPFDYVAKFELSGSHGRRHEEEINVTVEGAYVATAIGYGLAVEKQGMDFHSQRVLANQLAGVLNNQQCDLSRVQLNAFPPDALLDGVRIRPEYLRVALQPGGTLATVPQEILNNIFERLNRCDDVDFRYTIYDAGSSQGWQNIPLHNVAGLGIASGLRPFKQLARPMIFPPRSTVRVAVEEVFGRGVLYIALQGYKRIGAYGIGGKP